MYYVGIDISKYKHDCHVIDQLGEIIKSDFAFTNNSIGFAEFLSFLNKFNKSETRIGFEATSHYALNLKLFLEKHGWTFMEINPVLIKEFKKSRTLRKTTTDKISAEIIALYLTTIPYQPHRASFYHIYSLRSLTRMRGSLIKQRSRQLIALTNILDHIFPEFKPFFGNEFTVTALYILENYPSPENIANMNSRSYDILRRKSRGKFSMDKFVQLRTLARNTVGETNDIFRLQLETILDIYAQLDSKIGLLDDEIAAIVAVIDPPTLSIKGVGTTSAAVIIAEFGDFNRFGSPDKMLAFAGLEPGIFQSGTAEYTTKMVKHGSPHLRCAILNCCLPLIQHNVVFAEYYYKKINEGKTHGVACSHLARKLIRLIYTLETKRVKFDPELQR
jgi:transposase